MKKIISIIAVLTILFAFSACSNKGTKEEISTENKAVAEQPTDTQNETTAKNEQKILIAYFSVPENVDTNGTDAVAGASIVVSNEEKMGNTEYVANVIQKSTGGDLFEIKTEKDYPLNHEELVNYAKTEQNEDARPKLSEAVTNFEQYDVIFLGYPNWWADMPIYSFLESYDFSGKSIIPFITHGGSSASNTIRTISQLQPNALISDNDFVVSRNNVSNSETDITKWLEELGY